MQFGKKSSKLAGYNGQQLQMLFGIEVREGTTHKEEPEMIIETDQWHGQVGLVFQPSIFPEGSSLSNDLVAKSDEQIREYLEIAAIWENQIGDKDKGTTAYENFSGAEAYSVNGPWPVS
jgi:hypothetical protein